MLAYPLMAYWAAHSNHWIVPVVATLVLALALFYPSLRRHKIWAWLVVVAAASIAIILAQHNSALLILYVPPVAFNLLAAYWFGRSLWSGRTPLVTAIARHIRLATGHAMTPAIERYTFAVTLLWAMLLAGLAVVNALLAVWGSIATWAWFAHLGNYLIVAIAFALEFAARYVCLSQQTHPSWQDYREGIKGLSWKRLRAGRDD